MYSGSCVLGRRRRRRRVRTYNVLHIDEHQIGIPGGGGGIPIHGRVGIGLPPFKA